MARKLYSFGHLITDAVKIQHGPRTFQICAQQEIPETISDKYRQGFTAFPDDLKPFYHGQDIEIANQFLSGGAPVFDRPYRTF